MHDGFGAEQRDQGEAAHKDREENENIACQPPGLLLAFVGVVFGKDGDKGRGQGTLAEEVAQKVGNAEGNDKGVVGQAGAKEAGKDLLPNQTQEATAHNGNADGSCGTGDGGSGFGCLGGFSWGHDLAVGLFLLRCEAPANI